MWQYILLAAVMAGLANWYAIALSVSCYLPKVSKAAERPQACLPASSAGRSVDRLSGKIVAWRPFVGVALTGGVG
jgi:hypothetical protein